MKNIPETINFLHLGYATSLANNLREYPIEEVLSGPWLIEDWNPDLIKDVLDRLIPKYASEYILMILQGAEPELSPPPS